MSTRRNKPVFPLRLDRRQTLTGLAAGLALGSPLPAQTRGGKAIVIGAGAAGLVCAQLMKKSGMDVVVLEARDRIGGRLDTSRLWPDMPVELGASWIHDMDGNPAVALARDAGLDLVETDYESRQIFQAYDGELNAQALGRLERMEYRLERFARNAPGARLERDCRSRPRGTLENRMTRLMNLEALSRAKRRRGLFLLNTLVEHEYGAGFEELSRCFWTEGEGGDGEDGMVIGGLDRLAADLARGLDIRLSQPVEAVRFTSGGVEIKSADGQEEADIAVLAVPLGVLQAGAIRFEPELPREKTDAIYSLGSGLLNKCVLRFDETSWPADPELFNRLSDHRGAWSEFVNLSAYGAGPAIMCFNAADYARTLEQASDRETASLAVEALRSMFGNDFPEPAGVQITRWAADPFAGGSYSFPNAQTRYETRRNLLRPVDQRLFFAGEATSSRAPGTLHGAILSGRATANAVIAR